jgi:hypothetical protein
MQGPKIEPSFPMAVSLDTFLFRDKNVMLSALFGGCSFLVQRQESIAPQGVEL